MSKNLLSPRALRGEPEGGQHHRKARHPSVERNAAPTIFFGPSKFPVAAAPKVSYKHLVLIIQSPLAERLAILRAAPMPDASSGKLAAALHALFAAVLARLLDLVLLWQTGQLPPPPVRPTPQPRPSTPRAAGQSAPRRRTRVRRAAPTISAAPRPARAKTAHALPARIAPPRHNATGKPYLSPAARAPPPHPGLLRMRRPGRAFYSRAIIVTFTKYY